MEKVKCPNLKCGQRIFDIEEMSPGKVVLEMKCRHCGEMQRSMHGFIPFIKCSLSSLSVYPPGFLFDSG